MVTLAALTIGALVGVSLSVKDTGDSRPRCAAAASMDTAITDKPTSAVGAPVFRYLSPANVTVEVDEFDKALPSAVGENYIARDQAWKSENVSFELPGDGSIEYKVVMNQGDTIVYNWRLKVARRITTSMRMMMHSAMRFSPATQTAKWLAAPVRSSHRTMVSTAGSG